MPKFELGQMLHNNPVGNPCPAYVRALMADLRRSIGMVYSNVNQKIWPGDSDFKWWKTNDEERKAYPAEWPEQTGIPGVEWRDYYNWGGSPDDADWDQAKADAPNFSFEGVEIRWYKNFGRSMNCNVAWTPEQWVRWYDRCKQTLEAWQDAEDRKRGRGMGDPTPYPDPKWKVALEPNVAALYHLKLEEKIELLEAQANVITCEIMRALSGRGEVLPVDDYRYTKTLNWLQQLTGVLPKDAHWTRGEN